MTKEQLAEIRARVEAATPGPRVVGEHSGAVTAPGSSRESENDAFYGGCLAGESLEPHNSAFVAWARWDIPALLAEVDRLTADNAALVGALATIADQYSTDMAAGRIARDAIVRATGERPA